jgi:hypothetical protein
MTLASRKRRSVGALLVVETEVLRQRYELVERGGLFRFGERLVGEYVGEFEASVATQANGGEVTVVDERNDSGSTDAKTFCGLPCTQHVGYCGVVHRRSGRNARRTSAIAATTSVANTALTVGVVREICWPSLMVFSMRWSGSVCLGGTRILEMPMSRP